MYKYVWSLLYIVILQIVTALCDSIPPDLFYARAQIIQVTPVMELSLV